MKGTVAKPAEKPAIKLTDKQRADAARAQATLKVVLAQIEDMKAEDTVTIKLDDKSSVTDFIVVTTGRSNRHVASIADRIVEGLREIGNRARVEGVENADWVLIDAGDCIVHVFRPEVRTFYNLEKIWAGGASSRDDD